MSYFRRPSDPHATPSVFPTFLLPSIPFRTKSRQSSTDSTSSNLSTASALTNTSSNPFSSNTDLTYVPPSDSPVLPPTTGPILSGHSSRLHCSKCSTDLCLTSQIISKGFTGRHGRAYLVQASPSYLKSNIKDCLPNTFQNKPVPRNLVTGQHMVSDISCAICGSVLGWKYIEANEEAQKYKVGKFILETRRIRLGVSWENEEDFNLDSLSDVKPLPPNELKRLDDGAGLGEEEIEFDSQDEDECEDLFAGVWSPSLAKKRRARKNLKFGRRAAGSGLRSRSED